MAIISDTRKQTGRNGEAIARDYLIKKQHEILACNFHARIGELDIISLYDTYLVATEVKTYNTAWLNPMLVITPKKYQTMQAVIQLYRSESNTLAHDLSELQIRFDLVIVKGNAVTKHIENIHPIGYNQTYDATTTH